jgi:predicted Zn-dependent protease
MSSRLTDLPQVQALAEKFDLEIQASHRMVVTDWTTDYKQDHPEQRIIIEKVDVYDDSGNFVQTADLNKLRNSIFNYTVIFLKQ